ncbi:hypothetical protein [Streptomyces minutiscleroticus]|uniref:hypothetical protein n=1 Tax=Streptomyces minutiscleroticus TaxID=68238 RepID=UPI00332F8C55
MPARSLGDSVVYSEASHHSGHAQFPQQADLVGAEDWETAREQFDTVLRSWRPAPAG